MWIYSLKLTVFLNINLPFDSSSSSVLEFESCDGSITSSIVGPESSKTKNTFHVLKYVTEHIIVSLTNY